MSALFFSAGPHMLFSGRFSDWEEALLFPLHLLQLKVGKMHVLPLPYPLTPVRERVGRSSFPSFPFFCFFFASNGLFSSSFLRGSPFSLSQSEEMRQRDFPPVFPVASPTQLSLFIHPL